MKQANFHKLKTHPKKKRFKEPQDQGERMTKMMKLEPI